jgi:hypothetical protein
VKISEFFERFRKLADPSSLIGKIAPNDEKEKEFVSKSSLNWTARICANRRQAIASKSQPVTSSQVPGK